LTPTFLLHHKCSLPDVLLDLILGLLLAWLQVRVTLGNKEYTARVVGVDPDKDIAVLQVRE
jgi:hypothetical protein